MDYTGITISKKDGWILFHEAGSMKDRKDFEDFTDYEWVEFLKDPIKKLSSKKMDGSMLPPQQT